MKSSSAGLSFDFFVAVSKHASVVARSKILEMESLQFGGLTASSGVKNFGAMISKSKCQKGKDLSTSFISLFEP